MIVFHRAKVSKSRLCLAEQERQNFFEIMDFGRRPDPIAKSGAVYICNIHDANLFSLQPSHSMRSWFSRSTKERTRDAARNGNLDSSKK
jgi:hypothetical protein